ncbi:MAG: hypothetical protein KAQ75_01495, partial [Bacteroidales bacterium]|nr:hypothetical protein [Bacteroidales bacterium]
MRINTLLTLSVLLILSVSLKAQDYTYTETQDGVRIFHDGTLVVKEGIPFLTVKGDSYEMGLQYGVLLNDKLLEMDHTVDYLINSYIGSFFIKKWIANVVLNSKIKKLEKIMPEEYIQELEGMAEGSDLKLKELQIIAYF